MRLNNLKCAWIGLAVIGLAGMGARTVKAADAVTIGVVDEDTLDAKYKKFRDAEADIDKKAQDIEAKLASRVWLSDPDAKRFDELVMKDTLTAAEDKEMQDFVAKGTNINAEYLGLAGKVSPTDADNARLKALKDTEMINQPVVQKLEDQLLDKIKQVQQSTFDKYMKIVNDVMEDVAKSKNLTLIVRKRALLWSSPTVDITDAVLEKLNAPDTPATNK